MLMLAYMVGGWGWQDAYVIKRIIKSTKFIKFSSNNSSNVCKQPAIVQSRVILLLCKINSEISWKLMCIKTRLLHIAMWWGNRGWVGFRKSYVIFRVGHGKCLRPITRWVGGVKKGQKHAYVIFEWSLSMSNNMVASVRKKRQQHTWRVGRLLLTALTGARCKVLI